MTVSAGDVIRVTARLSFWGADDCQNVYHIKRTDGGADITDGAAVLDLNAMMQGLYGNLVSRMSVNIQFDDIGYFNVTKIDPIQDGAWGSLTAGTEAVTDMLPQQVAALVSAQTGIYRLGGRKYMGGFTEANHTAGGSLTIALLGALGNYAAGLISEYTGSSGTWRAGVIKTLTGIWYPFVSALVNDVYWTQRRRTFGVGS